MKKMLKPGVHWLYAFIPVTFWMDAVGTSAPLVFFTAALAIIPVAMLIGESTEHLAKYTGDAVGGLLSASFGKVPEIIFGFLALKAGLYELLLSAIGGGILLNLLLSTGFSFLVGGLKFRNQEFNPISIRLYNTMMLLAVVSLMIPSVFHQFSITEEGKINEQTLNLILSVTLLIGYVLYLVFMIKTHPDLFKSVNAAEGSEAEGEKNWTVRKSVIFLLVGCVITAFVSNVLVDSVEKTGEIIGLSEAFIGLIIVAIVSGAGEFISAVTMASKNKMDLSLGVAQGSSIQIALFLAPLYVLMSHFVSPTPFNLTFGRGLVIALFVSALVSSAITGDGRANWYKGVQLLILYFLIAVLLFFIPN
jgi:Ca2+:H+ antiporter